MQKISDYALIVSILEQNAKVLFRRRNKEWNLSFIFFENGFYDCDGFYEVVRLK